MPGAGATDGRRQAAGASGLGEGLAEEAFSLRRRRRRKRGSRAGEEVEVQAGETSEQRLRVLWVSKVECAGGARDGDGGGGRAT